MPTMSTKPLPDVGLAEGEECCYPCWGRLPDSIMLHIFSYLSASQLYQVSLVSKSWLRVAYDELLWKDLFYRHWGISRSIPMAPGKYSWIQEYKRLLYHTPCVESEVLKQHGDQVLHVSFSHNGKMFATCSKDGFIRVWDTCYPTSLKYKNDMRKCAWKYTQFSQFNSSDTLLLVSGVHFGSLSTSGEIAVFSLEGEFVMQSRVMNKPYDVFGTWYNDCYLLSGNLHWAGHLNSCSVLSINKAYQETESETESVMMMLFKFANINASSIRTIMVADCLNEEKDVAQSEKEKEEEDNQRTSQPVVKSDMIGVEVANQNDEKNERENDDKKCTGELVEKKEVKGVQAYDENGCLITKTVEEEDENSNKKLNGTIEYSRDYRLAEGPSFDDKLKMGENNGEVERSISRASSELSAYTSSSSLRDMDNGANYEPEANLENIEEDFMCQESVSYNFEAEIHRNEDSGNIVEENQSDNHSFARDDDTVEYNYEIVAKLDNNDAKTETKEELISAEFSVHAILDSLNTNDDEIPLNQEERANDDNDSQSNEFDLENPSQDKGNEKSESEDYFAVPDPMDATNKASNKRIMHGQQQQQGSKIRDPSTSDLENDDVSCNSSQSLSLPSNNILCTDQASFCCVDYKKLRKSSKPRDFTAMPKDLEIASTSTQDDQEMPGPSSSQFPCHQRRRGSKKQMKSRRQVSETVPEVIALEEPQSIVMKTKTETQSTSQPEDKYLIFTKGSETYTPHQIGIKRIKRFTAFNDSGHLLPNVVDNTQGLERGEDYYDEVDHLIDMNGHIIGMCLSPDQRYLYVNSRPWEKNYHIENPLHPPQIANEIDIHVIDLMNMREVGTMHRAHRAYTSNDECFFIFLDVCDEYVASGAEDKHGYLWDRHYGLCLKRYPHSDVVNSVAFNPMDPEVLVTVSDDFSIKIWRSYSRQKEVINAFNREHCIRLRHVRAIMSDTPDDLEQNQCEAKTI